MLYQSVPWLPRPIDISVFTNHFVVLVSSSHVHQKTYVTRVNAGPTRGCSQNLVQFAMYLTVTCASNYNLVMIGQKRKKKGSHTCIIRRKIEETI